MIRCTVLGYSKSRYIRKRRRKKDRVEKLVCNKEMGNYPGF
jgi:hypothetical protein